VSSSPDSISVFMSTHPLTIAVSSGSGQFVTVTAPFAPLKAVVKDAGGIPVQLAPVNYTAFVGITFASGGFGGPTAVVTDGSGIATAPLLTASTSVGPFTVTASAAYALSPATFFLNNVFFSGPANFVATALTPTSVSITWTAVPYALSYNVWRQDAINGLYTAIASHTTSLSVTDTAASQNTAYLYSVEVADPVEGLFSFDLATTVIFTDPTLTPGSTIVKAAHFNELRTAVNAVQVLAGQSPTSFTDPLTPGSTIIRAVHLGELRQALTLARNQMTVWLPAIVFTHGPPTTGTPITAADINDLRNGVR
jgi:hypothetical protein